MFMGTSDYAAKQKNAVAPINGTLLVIADPDLFSECLMEALGKKFPTFAVVSITSSGQIEDDYGNNVRLVLPYRMSGERLHAVLSEVREKHPDAPIALVVETIDKFEEPLKRLVGMRVIDGVLPLNLRLDVFMAAVDLLMKGGEHFPAALLGKLTPYSPSINGKSVQSNAVIANRADALAASRGDVAALTTREVQILDLLCKGTQNKIIADRLHLSENTVKVHVRNIYKKMNVRNRTEAASRFFNKDEDTTFSGGWKN
ncbi:MULTISPECIES: helix-turn-helix domain-containing protein [Agrobacterium]|jgi:DNA-binding NarL/FixJ family response regulator|uniref:Response regulator transcription factor n=1 Tax=Agrobacterium tumefaciens TaxID=358 RepID=A0AAP9E6T9_AGRTU|nr:MULTISPECIES: response regulator transcription factor [Agrobacterium]KAA1234181.1 response regulator transcription factor [Agrobacterium tumefaciens]MCW8057090.1 response regulator transcription factor [Agrobacterium tumefaciens]MCW8142425.1 response regulator transcription factor [Agrobacterium tumefaciens]NSZ59361.1 response regulator transcription factor [Agrobacterium tumefaciens]NUL17731.1 response regulator transcription factor [Agrobacterium tumefaciens]